MAAAATVLMLALHRIHRATTAGEKATPTKPAVAPKIEVIQPGFVFAPKNDEEFDHFEEAGAARELTSKEARLAKVGLRLTNLGMTDDEAIERAAVPAEAASTAGGRAKTSRQNRRPVSSGGQANPAPIPDPAAGGANGASGTGEGGDEEEVV